jgi:hypothetical protein
VSFRNLKEKFQIIKIENLEQNIQRERLIMKKQTKMVINVEEMVAGYMEMAEINLNIAKENESTLTDGEFEVYQLQA